MDLAKLTTEAGNPASEQIDRLSAQEIVELMNAEDATISAAVSRVLQPIATAAAAIADRLRAGGRLIYIGAGTSGRLGVLDASECPPTFNSRPWQVVGLIAGGPTALTRAVEGAEDSPQRGEEDLRRIDVTDADIVVGIATSGRTPYVVGGLRYARETNAMTVGLACNDDSALTAVADLMIEPIVGPEIVSGSTQQLPSRQVVGQNCPQAPQCCSLIIGSTQLSPQSSMGGRQASPSVSGTGTSGSMSPGVSASGTPEEGTHTISPETRLRQLNPLAQACVAHAGTQIQSNSGHAGRARHGAHATALGSRPGIKSPPVRRPEFGARAHAGEPA